MRLRYGAVPVKAGLLIVLVGIVCIGAVDAEIIGEKWIPVTHNANWSPRFDHTALVFDNKVWVLGGSGGNDVWDSSDGVTWGRATDSAGWLPRRGHSSVVFDNRMWVLGGDSGSNLKNDVWYSIDGSTWTQATAYANWSPRFDHTSLVFDNKMWVIGGVGLAPASRLGTVYKNDVWYSTDGSTWTQATAYANWSPRFGHTSLVFDNKMWVIGGEGVDNRGYSTNYNDAWYSTNGSTWIQATGNASWLARTQHQSVIFGHRMWVIGGYIGLKSIYQEESANDAWYSYEGKTWYPATDDAKWSPRSGHQVIVFNGRMWVLGGKEPGNPQNRGFDLGPGYEQYLRSYNVIDNDVWESVSVIKSPAFASNTPVSPIEKTTQSAPVSMITICLSLIVCILLCCHSSRRRKQN